MHFITRTRSNIKLRKYFYILSLIIIGMFLFVLAIPSPMTSRTFTLLGMKSPDINTQETIIAGILSLSLIIFTLGLLFLSKNWLVWGVLVTLMAPHIIIFVIFLALSSGRVIEALEIYGLFLSSWIPFLR